ncbi:MAG: 4Fe-4S dicluster domain-containing protein, partial [Eggerthellaceae bacterium]|nr:4Fe-4S dicluster domain-containing protein [Eggerthellaceae bacterium]
LSGMNAMAQLTENLEIVAETPAASLSAEEKAVFAEVYEAISAEYKVACTGCNYCMPCPNKVNIPGCFTSYNLSFAMGFFAGVYSYGNATLLLDTGARKCTQCGACLTKCPQGIEIPERLGAVGKRLEPLPIRAAIMLVRRFMR